MSFGEGFTTSRLVQLLVWVSGIVLLLAAVSAAFFRFSTFKNSAESISSARGIIFLNLAPGTSGIPFAHTFSFATGKIEEAKQLGITPNLSYPTGYIATVDPAADGVGDVYVYSQESQRVEQWVEGSQPTAFVRLSADGTTLVYNVLPKNSNDLTSISAYTIYTAEKGILPVKIAAGAYPQWSSDSRFILYVGQDGLRVFDTHTRSDASALPLKEGGASARMMLDLSSNGSKFVWTNPVHGDILIGRIESWQPFKASVEKIIPTHAFWPILSPDASKLAYEEVDWGPEPSNARLVIYDLASGTSKQVADLSAYNQMALFMSDWIY